MNHRNASDLAIDPGQEAANIVRFLYHELRRAPRRGGIGAGLFIATGHTVKSFGIFYGDSDGRFAANRRIERTAGRNRQRRLAVAAEISGSGLARRPS